MIKIEKIVNLLIVALYLSITDCFGLINDSYFNISGVGKLEDIFFLIMVLLGIFTISTQKKKVNKLIKFAIVFYMVFIIYLIFESIRVILSGQSLAETLRTIRYYFYPLVLLCFYNNRIDESKSFRLIIILEFISSLIYNIEFIIQKPILNGYYIYQNVGSLNLLRMYVGGSILPIFSLMFLQTLLINKKLNGKYFKKRTAIIMFISIFLNVVFTLSRASIIITALSCAFLALFSISKKNIILPITIILSFIIIFFLIIPIYIPSLNDRIMSTFTDNQRLDGGDSGVRINMMEERITYLENNNILLLGLGPYSENSGKVYFYSGSQHSIYTADIGYAELIIVLGFFGTIFFLAYYLYTCYLVNKSKSIFSKGYIIFLISSLILLFDENSLIEANSIFIAIIFSLIILNSLSPNFNNRGE